MSTRPTGPVPGTPGPGKVSLADIAEMKRRGQPIVMVTAYDFPSGAIADQAGVDLVLVGDSAAMTVLGLDSTVPATMEDMIVLTRAATRGARRPLVVADMPFMSYQVDDRDAIMNAGRLVKEAGADAVKLEGAGATLTRIRSVVDAGIPVCAHLGLTPQTATQLGGYRAQGRTARAALRLMDEARAVQAAGAFAVVLECVPAPVARAISESLRIPTIGIGAGSGTDGQVLVFHDMLGLGSGRPPRFVKEYAQLRRDAVDAMQTYASEVRSRAFPEEQHTYAMPADELDQFESALSPSNPVFE